MDPNPTAQILESGNPSPTSSNPCPQLKPNTPILGREMLQPKLIAPQTTLKCKARVAYLVNEAVASNMSAASY